MTRGPMPSPGPEQQRARTTDRPVDGGPQHLGEEGTGAPQPVRHDGRVDRTLVHVVPMLTDRGIPPAIAVTAMTGHGLGGHATQGQCGSHGADADQVLELEGAGAARRRGDHRDRRPLHRGGDGDAAELDVVGVGGDAAQRAPDLAELVEGDRAGRGAAGGVLLGAG